MTAVLTKEQKEQARKGAVAEKQQESNPAIAFLLAEIEKMEQSIAPTEEEIATLQASIADTRKQIELTREAVRVMRGEGRRPLPDRSGTGTGTRRTRRTSSDSGSTPASAIDRDALKKFVASQDEPVSATAIRDEFDWQGQGLSLVLREMVDAGDLKKEGEKRGTKYSVA